MKTITSTVDSKGKLTIPAALRRRLGIRKGTIVHFAQEGSRLILQPVTAQFIRSMRGSLKGKPSVLEMLLKERRQDMRRENKRLRLWRKN